VDLARGTAKTREGDPIGLANRGRYHCVGSPLP
jgi:hypothetical protein